MANLYVASTGSNTAPYDTWAKAATAPLTATAAAAAGDTIYQHAETFTISADTTYTLAAGVRWICTNDKANEPPQTQSTAGAIVSTTSNVDIYVQSAAGYVFGLTFDTGGSSFSVIGIATNSNNCVIAESCNFVISNTSSTSVIYLGQQSSSIADTRLINCSVKFAAAGQCVSPAGRICIEGGVYPDPAGTRPTVLFKTKDICRQMVFAGADLSGMTGGTVFTQASAYLTTISLSRCKLGAATLNGSITGTCGTEYFLYDCASSDTHYKFAHYHYLGSTTISTSIYANDGAEYNSSGDKTSWVVAGNANTSRGTPYYSPWISRYNEATAAVTPYIEILRDGSATAFTDIEVASEWMLKTVGGSPLATLYSDYGGNLSTGTAQGNGVGLSGWTGESGTAWSGKLQCPSVTPAEIGHVSMRVIVYGNHTAYADPAIRGT
ncbi:MAG: hypothetical protein IPO40_25035 [Fibrobacteres bacterium]|nr:hypothetical protein [Fibrobacterota bacterium]